MNKLRAPFVMKQFSIAQNNVALPVTSDACLFGAIIQLQSHARVLDIGTGTGLLCFMLAQSHQKATFTGIDIHQNSIDQANENNANNPFQERISFHCVDVINYLPPQPYDAIVCNPPFFEQHLPSENETRNLARHSNNLTLKTLLHACGCLLNTHGELFLLFPSTNIQHTTETLNQNGFLVDHITYIQARESKKSHLAMFKSHKISSAFKKQEFTNISNKTIVHYLPNGKLSQEVTHYLQEFYTRLS